MDKQFPHFTFIRLYGNGYPVLLTNLLPVQLIFFLVDEIEPRNLFCKMIYNLSAIAKIVTWVATLFQLYCTPGKFFAHSPRLLRFVHLIVQSYNYTYRY